MSHITVYRIEESLGCATPEGFDEVIDPDILKVCDKHDYSSGKLKARLYVPPPSIQTPSWSAFVEEGFPGIATESNVTRSALVIASTAWRGKECIFAIPFGHSRFMIRHDLVSASFGRQAALNIIYEGSTGMPNARGKVRQVDARSVDQSVRRSRVQRSRNSEFEEFGVDVHRDFMDQISGTPREPARFGSRVTGGTSIGLEVANFGVLEDLLVGLLEKHASTAYKAHFSWVDKIREVSDSTLRESLRGQAVQLAFGGAGIDLSPPEVLDWSQVAAFEYSIGSGKDYFDFQIGDYREAVGESRSNSSSLTYHRMLSHYVSAKDSAGQVVARWSVARALAGELDFKNSHYVLEGGKFYQVASDYLKELNDFVLGIPAPALSLPVTTSTVHEDVYNKTAVGADMSRLLLDRRTFRPPGKTTSVEICDIFTSTGNLVHVKRKLDSSELSHLFGQGVVSAETFTASSSVRTEIRKVIEREANKQKRNAKDFSKFTNEPFEPGDLTVVYAILADWKGLTMEARLPFFSKVNLRHHAARLGTMGFGIALAAIDAP